jgi:hypothetical protein
VRLLPDEEIKFKRWKIVVMATCDRSYAGRAAIASGSA